MPSRTLRVPLLALALVLAVAACGTEESEDAAGAPAGETSPAEADGAAGGAARIIIDGQAFRFEPDRCDVAEGRDGAITITGSGEVDGQPFDAVVSREARPTGSVIESVKVDLTGDAPADRIAVFTNVFAEDRGAPSLRFEDGSVLASIDFLATGEAPSGRGLVKVTCG